MDVRRRPAPATAVALAVEAVLAGVDVATASSIIFATAYVLAPLALATVAGPRQVLPVAVLALAIASGAWNGFLFSTDHVVRVVLVALAGTLAVLSARAREDEVRAHRGAEAARMEAEAARMEAEAARAESEAERTRAHERAHTLQASLLPERLSAPEGWELAATYAPGSPRPRSAATSTTSSRSTAV